MVTQRFSLFTAFVVLLLSSTLLAGKCESHLRIPRFGSIRNRTRSRRVLVVNDHGAKGDGCTDDTEVFDYVWRVACSFSTRITIVIPAGSTYLVRPLDFSGPCASKITLQISGSVIAPDNPETWKGLNPRKWLHFNSVSHLTVEGGGTIDGRGHRWWAQSCKTNKTHPCHPAPTAILFHRCKNLVFRSLTIINSQQMHVAFTNCRRVKAFNLGVIAPVSSPNTDGIHISSSIGVVVRDSIIRTGDDCISIVSNSSKIIIRNIVCGPGHGLSIGSLGKSSSWDQVHDVTVDGALLTNTQNGVRIKTWQGGRGFASNIVFQNVWMENVSNPIIIDQYYCDSLSPCLNQTKAVQVSNVSFMHIHGTSAAEEAVILSCSDSRPCGGLYLEDVELVTYYGGRTTSFCWQAYGASYDLVYPPPCFLSNDSLIKQENVSATALYSF